MSPSLAAMRASMARRSAMSFFRKRAICSGLSMPIVVLELLSLSAIAAHVPRWHLIGQAGPAVSLYQTQRQGVPVGKGTPRKCLPENRRQT